MNLTDGFGEAEVAEAKRLFSEARFVAAEKILIHENRDDIAAVSTTVIAIFTIVLVYFTIKLAGSTRIAADAANNPPTQLCAKSTR
jgi:hypothetical protein